MSLIQQAPPEQLLAEAQQRLPVEPQLTHIPVVVLQVVLTAAQTLPVQHC
jgi:hypothetical protein